MRADSLPAEPPGKPNKRGGFVKERAFQRGNNVGKLWRGWTSQEQQAERDRVDLGPRGDVGVAGARNKPKAESGAGHQKPWAPGSTSGL